MSTTNINIRVDKQIKEDAEILFNSLGLNMSTAMNVFLIQSIRQNGIPFEIKTNKYNKVTEKAIQDANQNNNLSQKYSTVNELFEDLDA